MPKIRAIVDSKGRMKHCPYCKCSLSSKKDYQHHSLIIHPEKLRLKYYEATGIPRRMP